MHLKQIEIAGFKSFATPTVLSFEHDKNSHVEDSTVVRGMTAIVGPNGSGKSNVSDAIRWVMGEQSMKNLRGKKSEDVIFAGSESKGKQSMARVALVFDNSDNKIPIEYDEVVVERKMYRSGEGEYLINGARVRMLDVVDLLAQAGMGKGSHCVVGQGMTDAILGATPVERRLMIEDAAGVKHFQIRKKRSEGKLERTRENLVRTRELIAEVEPRLKMLKRQAERAAKSKDVYEKLKSLQRVYFACMWRTFADRRAQIESAMEGSSAALARAQRAIDDVSDRIAAEAKKVEGGNVATSFEEEKNSLYGQLRDIDQEIARAKGQIEIQSERKVAEQKVKSIPVDLNYVRKQLDEVQNISCSLVQQLADHQKSSGDNFIERVTSVVTTLRAKIAALHSDVGKKTVALPANVNAQKIAEIDKHIADAQKIISTGEQNRKKTSDAISHIDQKISQSMKEDQQARAQFFVLEKEHRDKQAALDEVREKYNSFKVELAKIEVHEEDAVGQAKNALGENIQDLPFDAQSKDFAIDLAQSELKINALQVEYERIGAIDPLIVEEYEETRERFDFLEKECGDLEAAVTSLREVIGEMDKKIHDAFVTAYKEINGEFTKYFRILFGGGNARLKKIDVDLFPRKKEADPNDDGDADSDDVSVAGSRKTEIGIEMIASPPGKKISQLTLLSGGERSLTSVAMLFAIIAYNPPPFAVLDEVEAALDEANSRRLAKIFAELSGQTQFVIITHNRETMRHADMLYGVTMARDGSSQILSVKLDQLSDDAEEDA